MGHLKSSIKSSVLLPLFNGSPVFLWNVGCYGDERVPNRKGIVDLIMWGRELDQLQEKSEITPLSWTWYFTLPLCQHTAMRSVRFSEILHTSLISVFSVKISAAVMLPKDMGIVVCVCTVVNIK